MARDVSGIVAVMLNIGVDGQWAVPGKGHRLGSKFGLNVTCNSGGNAHWTLALALESNKGHILANLLMSDGQVVRVHKCWIQ